MSEKIASAPRIERVYFNHPATIGKEAIVVSSIGTGAMYLDGTQAWTMEFDKDPRFLRLTIGKVIQLIPFSNVNNLFVSYK
jgi:hypothetical protein